MLELKGTEKQVKWANDIRNELIKCFEIIEETNKTEEVIKEIWDSEENFNMKIENAKKILENEKADFYIDNFKHILNKDNNVYAKLKWIEVTCRKKRELQGYEDLEELVYSTIENNDEIDF
jgi:hypothetical protein